MAKCQQINQFGFHVIAIERHVTGVAVWDYQLAQPRRIVKRPADLRGRLQLY